MLSYEHGAHECHSVHGNMVTVYRANQMSGLVDIGVQLRICARRSDETISRRGWGGWSEGELSSGRVSQQSETRRSLTLMCSWLSRDISAVNIELRRIVARFTKYKRVDEESRYDDTTSQRSHEGAVYERSILAARSPRARARIKYAGAPHPLCGSTLTFVLWD